MKDFIEGMIGAAIAITIPVLIAYAEYRWQDRRKPSNAIFRHVENIILDKFNRRPS